MMVLYGIGTTIGAGIYALVGEIASVAGYFAPVSFLIASLMAGFTAISFAELCGRFPRAAGAALYVKQGFDSERLSTIVGLLVITAGLVSAAALVNGFVGYLHQFIGIERVIAIVLVTVLLGGIAAWGIVESVIIASLITVIEIGGLLLVIAVSGEGLSTFSARWTELIPSADITSWGGVYLGAVLSFYAFIGFEDMVDVAEEVKEVKRNLPLAILLTHGLSSRGQLPDLLGVVHHRTRTPIIATIVATVIVLILALIGRLAPLAEATSVIMLTIFSMVNLALWRIKRRDPHPVGVRIFPSWIPMTGFFVSFAFVLSEVISLVRM